MPERLGCLPRIVYLTEMKVLFWICLCCLALQAAAQAPNRLDRKGRKKGHWVTYADSAKTIKLFEGRFWKDKPKGTAYFYTTEGVLDRTEKSRFGKLKTRFYYPTGQLRMQGNARLENLPDRIHYYYYGRWKAYNDSGRLVKYYFYEKGELIQTVYLDPSGRINDSLIQALTAIDREFTTHNVALVDSLNAHRNDRERYQEFKRELARKDSLSFSAIDRILDTYGYPPRAVAGEVTAVPFFILGFAPIAMKEKHLGKLVMAATRDDISMKSLAFFIDKLKVAKGEKQVYGTQTYLKNNKEIRYPVEDEANLNQRRTSVGLDNVE